MSYYSTYFRVRHSAFISAGVFDGQMGEDVPMYVNPLLLRNCKEPEFENAYAEFLNYFNPIIILAKRVQRFSDSDKCFKQLSKDFSVLKRYLIPDWDILKKEDGERELVENCQRS